MAGLRCLTVGMSITAEDVYALAPYARTLGVRFTDLSGPEVLAELTFHPSLSTVGGGLHGGALMGLADVAAAVNAVPGAAPATTTSATQFLRPVRSDVLARAVVLHTGRSRVVVQVDVTDTEGSCACGSPRPSPSVPAEPVALSPDERGLPPFPNDRCR